METGILQTVLWDMRTCCACFLVAIFIEIKLVVGFISFCFIFNYFLCWTTRGWKIIFFPSWQNGSSLCCIFITCILPRVLEWWPCCFATYPSSIWLFEYTFQVYVCAKSHLSSWESFIYVDLLAVRPLVSFSCSSSALSCSSALLLLRKSQWIGGSRLS